ncbi:hypothetical protein SDC9_123210 [bioreactor metagenome]|uniref:Uncharacterized protein n=1 Tax=bioreactor metagenome TaxID=1076179 RepID=A0A645CH09_9ZZZZ
MVKPVKSFAPQFNCAVLLDFVKKSRSGFVAGVKRVPSTTLVQSNQCILCTCRITQEVFGLCLNQVHFRRAEMVEVTYTRKVLGSNLELHVSVDFCGRIKGREKCKCLFVQRRVGRCLACGGCIGHCFWIQEKTFSDIGGRNLVVKFPADTFRIGPYRTCT